MRRRRALAVAAVILAVAGLAWLAPAREQRLGTLAGARTSPDSSPHPTYVVESVRLATSAGRELSCLLRRPAAATEARLPAMLVAGGVRTGRRAVLAIDTAFTAIALACDYTWRDPARLAWPAFMLRLPRSRGEVVSTPQALALAATWLLGRADVDSTRFAVLGASLGLPPVAAWAARDARPRAVALLYGGGDLGAILEHNMQDRVRWAWLRRPLGALLGWVLRPLEPLRTVPRIAPRPLLLVASAADDRIPAAAVRLLFEAAGEPKRLVWLRGGHVLPREAELLRTLTDSILGWAEATLPGPGWRAPEAQRGARAAQ
jgi:fermentation-respiration switch protein FrsA (DUF1100 family)